MSIFLTLLEFHFSGLKSIFLYPEYQKMFLYGFLGKRSIFWQKPWTNPLAKCWFFSTFSDLHFWGPKMFLSAKYPFFSSLWELHFWGFKSFIFYPEYQKMFLSSFFCLKKHIRKRSIFWEKPWTNPIAKCRFFWLC